MNNPRLPLWAPYVSEISIKKGKLQIKYKGGVLEADPTKILSMMLYGDMSDLPVDVIDYLGQYGIPLIYHRRNMANAIWVHGGIRNDKQDILSKQIMTRSDQRRRTYIARELLKAKLRWQSKYISAIPTISMTGKSIKELRNIEAITSKIFWNKYYRDLGFENETRRGKNDVSELLNATSKFLAGIILRWITYHQLSPFHGYFHEQTDYPSLVYDLIEPYRYMECEAIRRTEPRKQKGLSKEALIAYSINNLKDILNEEIYCIQTRQYIRRQELLHGGCLALRAYLLGYGKRFVIPLEGEYQGGRPMKTDYVLPGKSAGFSKIYRQSMINPK